jgi:hypothetical protein
MSKSFNLMDGSYVQTDGFVLDANVVRAEEDDLNRIEVSAKAEKEKRKIKFTPEKNETPPKKKKSGTIFADWSCGKDTPVQKFLAKAAEQWQCQNCNTFECNKLTECPSCGGSRGVNASAGGIGNGDSMLSGSHAVGQPSSSGNILFSFGIPAPSTAAKAPSEHFAFGNIPAPASLKTFGSSATMGPSFPMIFGTSISNDAGPVPLGIPPSSSGLSASGTTFGATSPGGRFGPGGFNAPQPLN